MEHVNIDTKYNVSIWSDTEGTQPKYYKNGYWYKIDCLGKEGLAEQLASELLSCSNVKDFVFYKQCNINGKSGCKSANFLKEGEHFISFQSLYKNCTGNNIAERVREFSNTKERFSFICDFLKQTTGLNVSQYLQDILALDMLIKNPDRHFGNLGIILSNSGEFRLAPIFDNGQGLYQNFQITPPDLDIEEKDELLCAATISGSFEAQVMAAGIHMKINYDKLYQKLTKYPESIAKNCLLNQLNKYEKLFSLKKDIFFDKEYDKEIE